MNLQAINHNIYVNWTDYKEYLKKSKNRQIRVQKEEEEGLGFIVSKNELTVIERKIQGILPQDFKEFYMNYGCFVSEDNLTYYADFAYLEEGWKTWLSIDEFSNIYVLLKYTEQFIQEGLIPSSFFVINEQYMGESEYIYLLMGIADDNHGKIFLWPRRVLFDENEGDFSPLWGIEPNTYMIPIADSFTDFLKMVKTEEEREKNDPDYEFNSYKFFKLFLNFDMDHF